MHLFLRRLAQVLTSVKPSRSPPPKPTSGLFIVFVKALILLIEGLFVCLLACMWAVAGNTRPRWKKSCSLLPWTWRQPGRQHEKRPSVCQTVNRFLALSASSATAPSLSLSVCMYVRVSLSLLLSVSPTVGMWGITHQDLVSTRQVRWLAEQLGFRHSQHAGLLANQNGVVQLPVATDGRREEVPPLEGKKTPTINWKSEGVRLNEAFKSNAITR